MYYLTNIRSPGTSFFFFFFLFPMYFIFSLALALTHTLSLSRSLFGLVALSSFFFLFYQIKYLLEYKPIASNVMDATLQTLIVDERKSRILLEKRKTEKKVLCVCVCKVINHPPYNDIFTFIFSLSFTWAAFEVLEMTKK